MKNILKLILIALFGLVGSVLLARVAAINYFKTHPTAYKDYMINKNWDRRKNSTIEGMSLDMPVGGCWNTCNGETQVVKCEVHNAKWDYCEIECKGYFIDSCNSTLKDSFFDLLTRNY